MKSQENQRADFFPNYKSPAAQSHDDVISHNLISLIPRRNKSFPYLILDIKYIMVWEKSIIYHN